MLKKRFFDPEIELLYFDEEEIVTDSTKNNSTSSDDTASQDARVSAETSVHITDVNTSGLDWSSEN